MRVHTEGLSLECVGGDITRQEGFDAVVNAANAQLRPGGGVAGAIHRAAGPELDRACRPLAPITTGEAVITEGFDLPNPHVIHVLGPVYGQSAQPARELAEAYESCLQVAERYQLESVAFCAISTGAFGYPVREAAEIAFTTLLKNAGRLSSVGRVRMVLYDEESLRVHEDVLEQLTGEET